MKKFFLYFLGFIVLILTLIVTLPYVFKDQIKAKLLQEVDNKIDGEFSFSDFTVSSFKHFPHMTINVHDFCIVGKEDFNGDTLAYAKIAAISFDYYQVIKGGKIDIKRVHLTQPLVRLRTLSNGDVNYDIFKSDSTSQDSTHFNININQWIIEDGRFSMYDRPQRSYLELLGINHKGNGDFTEDVSDLTLSTTVNAVSYSFNGINYLDRKKFKTNMVMEMDLLNYKFTFKDHIFELNHFKFGFEGYMKFLPKGYEMDLHLLVDQTDFKNFLSVMPGFYIDDFKNMTVSGVFSLDGRCTGVYDYSTQKLPTFSLDLKVKDGSFKYSHLPKAMEHINMEMLISNPTGKPEQTTIDIKNFQFDVDKRPVTGRFKMKGMTNPVISADIKVDVDIAELEKMHPINGLSLRGNLLADIEIDGEYAPAKNLFPAIDAKLKLDSGYIKSDTLPSMEKIHIDAEVVNKTGTMNDTHIDLIAMNYEIDGDPFRMKGTITNLADYHYDLTVNGQINLKKLTALYPIDGIDLSGELDIRMKSSGTLSELEAKQFDQIRSTGKLEIKNVVISGREIAHPISIRDAKLFFNPERITLNNFDGKIGNCTFALQGDLFSYMPVVLGTSNRIKGDLDLQCDTLDINALSSGKVQAQDTAKSQLKIVQIPPWIDFRFDAKIGYIKFGAMDIEEMAGEVLVKDQVVTLKTTTFTSQDAKFIVTGTYQTVDPKHPLFDVVVDIDKLDINKAYNMFETMQSAAPAAENTDGLFSTKYHLKGELASDFTPNLNTLAGGGTITIGNAQIKGTQVFNHVGKITKKDNLTDPQIANIVMETEIKDAKVWVKPFSFQMGKYHTELEGSHGFDNVMDYILWVSVPPLNKVRVPFHITGTVDKPIVKLGKGHEKFDFSDF